MKRLIALILLFFLLIPAALGETFQAPHAFTIELPKGWRCDYSQNSFYSHEASGYHFLGIIDNHDKSMEISIQSGNGTDRFSLYGAKQKKLLEHQSAVAYSLEKNGLTVEYMGIFEENEKKIPFMIFFVKSKDQGDYFYAHTVSNDWWIEMYYYNYFTDTQIKPEEIGGLHDLLRNFQPIL